MTTSGSTSAVPRAKPCANATPRHDAASPPASAGLPVLPWPRDSPRWRSPLAMHWRSSNSRRAAHATARRCAPATSRAQGPCAAAFPPIPAASAASLSRHGADCLARSARRWCAPGAGEGGPRDVPGGAAGWAVGSGQDRAPAGPTLRSPYRNGVSGDGRSRIWASTVRSSTVGAPAPERLRHAT